MTVQITLEYGEESPEFTPLFAKLSTFGKQKAELHGIPK